MPSAAAIVQSTSDSPTISRMILRPRQPIARRIPISRVRSKTDMVIVFITPIAPITTASSEIASRAASASRSVPGATLT